MKKIILIIAVLIIFVKISYAFEVDLKKIAMIESSNNPLAISYTKGFDGRLKPLARGLCQIMPITLQEYNQRNNTKLVLEDLFNAEISKMISNWYYNKIIPEYFRAYKIQDTIENRLVAYNWGVGNLRKYLRGEKTLPKETRDYIIKYNK